MKKIILQLVVLFFLVPIAILKSQEKHKSDIKIFNKIYSSEELIQSKGYIKCASTEYESFLQKQFPNRATNEEFEAWLAPLIQKALANKSQSGGVITIPVVVHIIHSGQPVGVAPNITDEQVISQITVMNQDFRKMMGTPGYNTHPVGADTMIQFALAKVDPNGNPTNGINRVNLCQTSWSTADIEAKVKPQTIWNPNDYMNMWSVNFSDNTLLGYAQFPTTSSPADLSGLGGLANTDGVVSGYSFFGSSDFNDGSFLLSTGYDKGRTMTHEVGHFLGLRHIWGDSICGNDYCADTPVHRTANYGCFTHPKSNTCGTADEMFENYMDYTDDVCMNIFTAEQATRMNTVLNNATRRSTLKTSTKDQAIPLFANDAEVKIENLCSGTLCGVSTNQVKLSLYNRGTSILNSATIQYSYNNGSNQTINWSGALSQDKLAYITINLPTTVSLSTFTASILSANGTTDQRTSNNVATKTFGVSEYNLTSVVFRLQRDFYGSETSWKLQNQSGSILYSGGPYSDTSSLPALITQTWTLPANNCYIFTINDSYGDGICCDGGNGYFDLKSTDGSIIIYSGGAFGYSDSIGFKILTLGTKEVANSDFNVFPIPVENTLNISDVSDKTQFEIYNSEGRLMKKGTVKDNKIEVSWLSTGNYILKIIDLEREGNVKFIKK